MKTTKSTSLAALAAVLAAFTLSSPGLGADESVGSRMDQGISHSKRTVHKAGKKAKHKSKKSAKKAGETAQDTGDKAKDKANEAADSVKK